MIQIRRIGERDIGRSIPEPVKPVAAPPPAPAPPSNRVKVTIVRNGVEKEYSVIGSEGATTAQR